MAIRIIYLLAFTITALFLNFNQVFAALEWQVGQTLPLEAEVQDISESPDGKRLFVLTNQGNVLVYGVEGELGATISVPFRAKSLDVSRDGSKLYLAGEETGGIQVISLTERYSIDVGNSPVRGDPAAPVAIVVFSDFQ